MLSVTNFQGNADRNMMSDYLTPDRTAAIRKTRDHRCWPGCGATEAPPQTMCALPLAKASLLAQMVTSVSR